MAGKKKKDQNGEGAKGFELPKTIAGVKLPKDIRGSLVDLARHPVVADLLAAGLVALAARLKDEPAIRKGAAKAGDAAHDLAEGAGSAVAALVEPLVKRTRKLAAEPDATSTAPTTRRPRKTTGKPKPVASKPATTPVKRTSAAESSASKPRAARRPTLKAPAKPKPSKTDT